MRNGLRSKSAAPLSRRWVAWSACTRPVHKRIGTLGRRLADALEIRGPFLTRDHQVEYDQVDSLASVENRQGLVPRRRPCHAMAGDFQKAAHDVEHGAFIVNDQDLPAGRVVGFQDLRRLMLCRRLHMFLPQPGQIQAHAGSVTNLGIDCQKSLVAMNDAEGDRQSQACSLADFLGREERVEGLIENFGRHARAVVFHLQDDIVAGRNILGKGRQLAVDQAAASSETRRGGGSGGPWRRGH